MPKSKAGWLLATIYLVASSFLLVRAFHCNDGFFCGIGVTPMLIPAGLVYLALFGDQLPGPPVLQWQLIVPTLLSNTAIYYLLGRWLGKLVKRRR